MGMTIGRKVFCYVLIAALACSNLVFAAPKNKDKDKDKENAEVKFTARAELVLVPVLVADKSGNHITGLKQEDFTVLENGAEQKIATFEEITSDAHRIPHQQKPNEFSNSVASGPSARRITLMVLDLLNTRFMDQAYARQDLLKYLTQSVDQREPTALYTLTRSGIHVIHDFTTDPRVLVAALHKVKGDAYQMVDSESDVEAITGTASPDGSAGVDPGAVQSESQKLQTMMEDHEFSIVPATPGHHLHLAGHATGRAGDGGVSGTQVADLGERRIPLQRQRQYHATRSCGPRLAHRCAAHVRTYLAIAE